MKLSKIANKIISLFQKKQQTPEEEAKTGFTNPSEYQDFKSKFLPYVAVIVLVAGMGITIYQLQFQQDMRQRASEHPSPVISHSITNTSAQVGDINHDNQVTIQDLNILVSDLNMTGKNLPSDLDYSGKVDMKDYTILITNLYK